MNIRVRTSAEQFTTMLEFMELHGDLAKPVGGSQGRVRSEQLWSNLTNTLNAIGGGVTKTADKWRKVWADWKSKTKKKSLMLRKAAEGTGGGPASHQTLSDIDQRMLAIMGPLAVQGQDSIEELGFITTAFPSSQTAASTSVIDNDNNYMMQMDNIIMNDERLPTSPELPQPSLSQNTTLEGSPLIHVEIPERRQPNASPLPQPLAPQASLSQRTRLERRHPNASPLAARRRLSTTPLTPHSAGSPRRPNVRRRRRGVTPFERVANEYTAVEIARLELEEKRAQQIIQLEEKRAFQILQVEEKRSQQMLELEEKRSQQMMQLENKWVQLHHERELRALEIEKERTAALSSIVKLASDWLEHLKNNANTQPINIDE